VKTYEAIELLFEEHVFVDDYHRKPGYSSIIEHLAEKIDGYVNDNGCLRVEVSRLRVENGRLREALKYYAEDHYPKVNEGPWGANSSDFGDVARAALAEGEKTND